MDQMTLFDAVAQPAPDISKQPLAARLRPRTLDDFVGQTHLLGPDRPLRRLIERAQIS